MLVRDLVKATALEANPVCILLDAQIEGLPVLAPLDVVLLYQIGALTPIEAGNDE